MMMCPASGKDGTGLKRATFGEAVDCLRPPHAEGVQAAACRREGPLSRETLVRVLRSVDAQRSAPHAQTLYSRHDKLSWFETVTDQLYRNAIAHELRSEGGAGAPPPEVAEAAVEQVYGCRAFAAATADAELQAVLRTLVHVKHDHAFECPVRPCAMGDSARGDSSVVGSEGGSDGLVPAGLRLYPIESDGAFTGGDSGGGGVVLLDELVHDGADLRGDGVGCHGCRPRPTVLLAGSWS